LAPIRVRGFFPRGERAKWTIALQVKYGLTSGRDDSEIMTDYGPEFCGELIQRLLSARAEVRAAVAAMDEEELGEVDETANTSEELVDDEMGEVNEGSDVEVL
jgi:hypothetical protein